MISKQLVEMMGGQIGVDSTAGQGSTFWFTARLARAKRAISPHEDTAASAFRKPGRLRILLVEDNPVNQMVACALLRKPGHEVTVVDRGTEALAVFANQDFDLVVMDIEMPDMDGLEVTARIREMDGRRCRVPIIAMTAYAMKGDRETFLAAGMDGYIAKPVRAQELFETLQRVISERRGETPS